MAFNKKKEKKKKKGPKGKVARAKAKLDRQWGEEADEEVVQKSKIRHGRSRINNGDREGLKSSGATFEKPKVFSNEEEEINDGQDGYNSVTDDDDSDDDDSDDDDNGLKGYSNKGAYDNLLSKIKATQGKGIKRKLESNSNTTDEKESFGEAALIDTQSHDDGSTEEESVYSNTNTNSDGEDDSEVEDNVNEDTKKVGSNPFTNHFSVPAFPSDEAASMHILESRSSSQLLSTPYLDPSLELRLSGCSRDETSDSDDEESLTQQQQQIDKNISECRNNLSKLLKSNWKSFNSQVARSNTDSFKRMKLRPKHGFSALQASILPTLSSYADILCTAETQENRDSIQNLAILHILNHVITSRNRVQKHDRRIREILRKDKEEEKRAEEEENSKSSKKRRKNNLSSTLQTAQLPSETKEHWRDQGYTRPKVLVLLPTRGTCLHFVRKIVSLLGNDSSVENLDRFEAEYGIPELNGENEGDVNADVDKAEQRRKAVLESKGHEWNELFGEDVNQEDEFKIGMNLSSRNPKKKEIQKNPEKANGLSMKLYSEFYQSDIIFASPLGLKMTMNSKEDEDCDYLSSTEICIVPHSDVLLMQNWDHVMSVLDCLNQQPKNLNTTDFSRVRYHLLEGQGAYWRQLIFLSTLSNADIVSTFKRYSKSIAGSMKIRRTVPLNKASICDVLLKVKQVFQRIPCDSVATQAKERLKYFRKKMLPQLLRLNQKHTLIYIPSYFDFVAVRNILTEEEASFVSVTEYSRVSEVSRGRARFHQGRKNIMLYTGRAHFFQRHYIKGITHLIFYGLPEHADFYPGLIHMLRDSGSSSKDTGGNTNEENISEQIDSPASCLALFTKYDAHEMERIVGTKNCARMVQGAKDTYLFC